MHLGSRSSTCALLSVLAIASCSKAADEDHAAPSSASSEAPQSASDRRAPLAVVDGTTITVGDFQEQVNKQSPYLRPRYESLDKRKEFLTTMIRFELLAKEAKKRGYDSDPTVIRAMKQVMIQKLIEEEFEAKLSPDSIPEADLRAYFDAHKDDYNRPEEIRASAIVLTSAADAERVGKEAKGEAGASHKGFRDLVSKYSTDEHSKARGGDLQYLTRDSDDFPKAIIDAVFGMKRTGEVVGPIRTDKGFFILKQTGKKKALSKDFEEVRASIQNRLYRDKRTAAQRAFIEGLKAEAKIEINEENLAKIHVEAPKPSKPSHGHEHGETSHGHEH